MLVVNQAVRKFKYKDDILPDPDPAMTPVQVIEYYSSTHPELTTAVIGEPELDGDDLVYELKGNVGTKA